MQPGESAPDDGPSKPDDPMERLSASARGWHTIQLAVLGFIGICGVLRSSSSSTPNAVQVVAAILAVAALAVACVAIFTVGRVAYPLSTANSNRGEANDTAHARSLLRTGITLTVVALILIVIAALSGWWPSKTNGATKLALTDTTGRAWCGPIVSAPDGTVRVSTTQGIVTVPLQTVVQLRFVTSCP